MAVVRAPRHGALFASLLAVGGLLSGCAADDGEPRVEVVASFYPLAWAAERVGGDRVVVADLTPPGGEAHDATLTAGQRAELQTADVVLLLGRFGFQPEVERAATETSGLVVDVTEGLELLAAEGDLRFDPHLWLDPTRMEDVVRTVADALAEADPGSHDGHERREADVLEELGDLDGEFGAALSDCEFRTFVATHQAFGYLAERYGLEQIGILGVAPESEPAAERIQAAEAAIRDGLAAPVVFAEATAAGRRIADGLASQLDVPVLPLSTLESAPPTGDYLSVMEDDLDRIREGLRCN